jgi:carotenoid cleavage dioxygenase-like enzyme
MEPSRRDLLRLAGLAPLVAMAASCSDDQPVAIDSGPALRPKPFVTLPHAPTTVSPPTTLPPPTTTAFDTAKPWWLQGNFAPIFDEVRSTNLEVQGALPAELNGLYVRNGSNPQNGDSPHWFFGDGMTHGVRLGNGKAEWYANRYVQTTMYTDKLGFGEGPPGGASNQSNVSCIWHGGKLLTSGEVGFPYELDPADQSTKGVYDFGGKLPGSFTAHPKIDPATGRMHSFGYGFTDPFLTYHITEADGTLVHSEDIALPRSVMMHDFCITESDAVFWDLPVTFDLEAAIRYIATPGSGAFPYAWTPEHGARIGVMPLTGGADQIRWFEIDPCYVFHGVNSFRRGDEVVIDVCRLDSMFDQGQVLGGELTLRRWTVNTATGSVTDDVVNGDEPGELPGRDPRRVGRDYRYGYFAATRKNTNTAEFGGLIKHDYGTNSRDRWDPGPTQHTGEWLFVPAGDDEDAGYLITYLIDEATSRSELVVVDATAIAKGPIARVALPNRIPYGFHAAWVPNHR